MFIHLLSHLPNLEVGCLFQGKRQNGMEWSQSFYSLVMDNSWSYSDSPTEELPYSPAAHLTRVNPDGNFPGQGQLCVVQTTACASFQE